MGDFDEKALINEVVSRHDKHAFDLIVKKYQSCVRRFFLNQTMGDQQLSDDLAQDTFIKVYLNLAQFRGESAFLTWIYRIAYNVFYDYHKKNRPTTGIDNSLYARAGRSKDSNLSLDLYAALAILNEAERACITLQLMEGEPIKEIAKVTNLAEGTVKSLLFRAKGKLTSYLKQNGYDGKR